jgi:hypothetical protein
MKPPVERLQVLAQVEGIELGEAAERFIITGIVTTASITVGHVTSPPVRCI